MKRLFFLCFILLPVVGLSKPNPDSLHQVIQDKTLPDSSHWKAFEALVSYYGAQQPDSVLSIAQKFYSQAKGKQDKDAMARALAKKGGYYDLQGDFGQALTYFNQSLKIYEKLGSQSGKADVLNNIGTTYAKQRDYPKALDYYHRSLAIQDTLGTQLGTAHTLNNMGLVSKFQGNYTQALEYQKRSLQIYKLLDDPPERDIASCLNNLGNIYSDLGNYDQALNHYRRSHERCESLEDFSLLALVLGNIGTIYFHQGDFAQAEENFKRSLAHYETQEHQGGIAQALLNLGLIYQNQSAFPQALNHFQRCLKVFDKLGDPYGKALTYQNTGLVYQSLGDYTQALEYFQHSLELFEKMGDRVNSATMLATIGSVYRDQGEPAQALDLFQRALTILDSLGHQDRFGETLLAIGNLYRALDDSPKALDHLQRGLKTYENLNNQLGIATAFTSIGNVYRDQGDYTKARFYGEKALPLARKVGNVDALKDVSTLLYTSYKALGQPALALEMYELSIAMKDSLNSIENQSAAIRYAYEQQALKDSIAQVEKTLQAELNFQQQLNQKDQTRNILIALGILAFILAVGFYARNRFVQRTNAQLKVAKERAEQAEMVKTRLYTNISHEFRTPLTIIQGMSEKVIEAPEVWGEKGGEMIRRNSDQLLFLVNQMLDLRKLESNSLHLQMIQGDIISYLRYIIESFHSLAESKEIRIEFHTDTHKLLMDHDPPRTLQILSNLLSNAIKFTPRGGTVGLRIRLLTPQTGQHASLKILVSDTGMGIPRADLPHIFNRFYQGESAQTRKGEGTGIGLALTKELVHLLGGTVSVRSTEDEGTTFEVILPISRQAPLSEASGLVEASPLSAEAKDIPLEEVVGSPANDKPLVLLVEDNADVVQYLIACLQNDYRLEVAMDGQQGIEKALEIIPDLVVTDVMMPEKDGFEVAQFLKNDERTSHIPIIMLTAKADVDSKIEGLERGADAYLPKPFHPPELLVRLKKLLELRQKLRSYYLNLAGRTTEQANRPELELALEVTVESTAETLFVQKVRSLIEAQLLNPDLKVETLCRELGMSHSQLHRKLTALTGYSTNRFIRYIRLSKARNLLATPDITISEAAYEAGFSDPDYFTRTFKKEYGMTPTVYREGLG